MPKLTNVYTAPLGVRDSEGNNVRLMPGQSVDAKGSFTDNLFVKAGWLKAEGKDGAPAADTASTAITVEDITEDGGDFTVRASDGVVFSPSKNQVREDGTLTSGGMKAYETAKTEQDNSPSE